MDIEGRKTLESAREDLKAIAAVMASNGSSSDHARLHAALDALDTVRTFARSALAAIDAALASGEQGRRTMDSAPKDGTPILAWCDHEADSYVEDEATGRLTLYAAHYDSMSHATNGWNIVQWGGAFDDTSWQDFHQAASLPDWWFVVGSEFEVAANPLVWMPLPAPPAPETRT